jgi:predicted ATPase
MPGHLVMLAESYGKAGRIEEGLAAVTEAMAAVADTGARLHESGLYRLKGELLRQKAEDEGQRARIEAEAEACFLKALEISRRQSAKSMELRTAMSLSRLWQHQGKKTEARRLLAEIYDWFTEGFDTPDLLEAKALLEELS